MPISAAKPHRSQSLTAATAKLGKSRLRSFWRDESGGIGMMYGLMLPGLIGFLGLGVEAGYWYLGKRDLQTQADAASIGGTWEVVWHRDSQITPSATNEAVRNGFPNTAVTSITVNNPPTSGAETGNIKAVEVILTRDYDPMFSALFMSDDITIAARAVSTLIASGSACVLALNGTVSDAAENIGGTTINAPDCTIAANSNAEDAISFSGSADILFESAWTVGDIEIDGTTNVTFGKGTNSHMWPIDDPYADLDDSAPLGCEVNGNQTINNTVTITADGGEETICGDIRINGGAHVDFEPGTYWMKGSSLIITGGTVICSECEPGGDGVTFIFTTPPNGNVNQIGTMSISGNAQIELNAPRYGEYHGVLFFQDHDTPTDSNKSAALNGGSDMILNGAIYFPNNEIQWSGNDTIAATCTLLIGDTVEFSGDSGLSIADCASQGIDIAFTQRIALVE